MVDLARRKTLFATGSVLAGLATAPTAAAHGGSHSDGEIEAQVRHEVIEPEILPYEPTENGYNLVGGEYFARADQFEEAPSQFGETFAGPMPAHSKHGGPHYDLHVWCWKANPNGMFAPWTPNISCDCTHNFSRGLSPQISVRGGEDCDLSVFATGQVPRGTLPRTV